MPFSGGTAGAHDDAMHQGNAKRDVAEGLAGLDVSGFVLAKGPGIAFPRSGSDDVHIYERTSGEEAYAFHRVGADDYTFFIKESNVWKRFQTESMKDAANGIAALDAGGHVLAPGYRFTAVRGAAEQISIRERTSDERVFRWIRIGADDYEARVTVGGVEKVVQHAGLKDAANGIAALNGAGGLLIPGSDLYFTRSIVDRVYFTERTSGESILYFKRHGADDYKGHIYSAGVAKELQHAGLKDAASGIAGLDANILLDPALLPPCMEEYSNHLGAVDNFSQTGVAGTGSVNPDAANHEMDLDGGGGVGHARFETKAAWVAGSNPMMINILVQNIVNGSGGAKVSFVGCKADMSATSILNSMGFRHIDDGTWQTASGDASGEETNAITALANGDLVSILATSAAIRFFVNGTLVQTHTTRIPAVGVNFGGAVDHTFGAPSPHRQLSIDMMSGRRYV